jgi:hypothetical protein
MKLPKISIVLFALCQIAGIQTGISQSQFESGKLIPVYPGATLITEPDPGEESGCCNFKTNDSFEKVISFYESSLKLKALDVNELASQHTYLKAQTDMMLKEMPAGMKIKFFVLKVVEFQGQKGAELFEVYTSPRGVEFSLMESQLRNEDQHFIADLENSAPGRLGQVDPKLLISVLPPEAPSGYTKDDVQTDQSPGRPVSLSTGYTKVIRQPKFSEFGDDPGLISNIGIGIEEAEKEFYEEMIKPLEGEKNIMVKGKYRGIERITKEEGGLYTAETIFVVNNKFLVTLSGVNLSDPKIVIQVIDKMNLEALSK